MNKTNDDKHTKKITDDKLKFQRKLRIAATLGAYLSAILLVCFSVMYYINSRIDCNSKSPEEFYTVQLWANYKQIPFYDYLTCVSACTRYFNGTNTIPCQEVCIDDRCKR